ncbi:MAG: NUDIX hydrolase, partial [Betaproteobacteria bacterium]|nr:NUDIX hydrolase [Betaproteobacteria bacterium]
MADDNLKPPLVPRAAATVTLVRDAPGGFEVLMMQRNFQSVFMPGVHVFPGGAVDKHDSSAQIAALCMGLDDAAASRKLGIAQGGQAYWVAAIREAFEEAGILLACDERGEIVTLDDQVRAERFHSHRRRVEHGEHPLSQMLREEGLRLPLQQMVYFSHWITPVGAPRRYDTRFFVAAAPEAQKPLHDNRETINHVWVKPGEALDRNKQKKLTLRTPTIHTLRVFAEHDNVKSLTERLRALGDIPVLEPRIAKSGRRVLPGDPDYDA